MKKNEKIDHPKHYTKISNLECIDIAKHFNFCLGNAIKYILLYIIFKRNIPTSIQ